MHGRPDASNLGLVGLQRPGALRKHQRTDVMHGYAIRIAFSGAYHDLDLTVCQLLNHLPGVASRVLYPRQLARWQVGLGQFAQNVCLLLADYYHRGGPLRLDISQEPPDDVSEIAVAL